MNTEKRALAVLAKQTGPLTFGMFLRAARTAMEVTQIEMARRLGISRSALCDIEKGRHLVSPELAVKIAKTAGLSTTLAVKACLQDPAQQSQNQAEGRVERVNARKTRLVP